jgi:hypothetical protein
LIQVIRDSVSGAQYSATEDHFMSENKSMEYYRGRALRERELARASASASVARIHIEMAEHYENIVLKAQLENEAPAVRFAGR